MSLNHVEPKGLVGALLQAMMVLPRLRCRIPTSKSFGGRKQKWLCPYTPIDYVQRTYRALGPLGISLTCLQLAHAGT